MDLKTFFSKHTSKLVSFGGIKKLFNSITISIKKLYFSKILGKKYIRSGSCNACGRCCQTIYVRHARHVISEEEEFKMLQSQHFFYSWLKVVDKDETGLIFECTKLDKETGRCTEHKNRPAICRQYPLEEVFMLGGIISEDCGYKFIPIKSFDEVLSKVEQKMNKQ